MRKNIDKKSPDVDKLYEEYCKLGESLEYRTDISENTGALEEVLRGILFQKRLEWLSAFVDWERDMGFDKDCGCDLCKNEEGEER